MEATRGRRRKLEAVLKVYLILMFEVSKDAESKMLRGCSIISEVSAVFENFFEC